MQSAAAIAANDSPPFHAAGGLDYLPPGPLKALQRQRLAQTVRLAYARVPFYRHRMDKQGVTPDAVVGPSDVTRLPLCSKADLGDGSQSPALAVLPTEVARWQAVRTSAGKPIVVAHTKDDLNAWHELLVRSLVCCGVRPGDVILNVGGYNLFNDPLGLHAAAESLGAAVMPGAPGDADGQLAMLKQFGISVICAAPSHFAYLVEQAAGAGLNPHDSALRIGVMVDEPWSEEPRREIERALGVRGQGIFGVGEIFARGIGAECGHQGGVHLFEDHFLAEIINSATGELLGDGEEGELVLTTLTRQAMPLLRYRTGRGAAIVREPCPCGRTMRRVRLTVADAADAMVVQGVPLCATQIEAVLRSLLTVLPPYRIAPARDGAIDRLEVQVGVTPEIFRDRVGAIEGLRSRLAQEIQRVAGVYVPVRFVEPHGLADAPAAAKAQ